MSGCDCDSMCESVLQNAYNTGYLQCEKKENGEVESFADCQTRLNDALAGAGRFPALEALIRDHYMKCMCVSRQDNTATCYEGSQGIPPGKRWCDPTTNSWLKIMNDKCPGSGPSWCGAPAPQCQAKFPTLAALRTQSARLPTAGLAMLLGAAGGVSASLTIVAVMRKVTSQREPSEYVNLAS